MNSKWESFEHIIKHFKVPSCILLQETKLTGKLKKKLNGYEIFQKPGGDLLTAVDISLDPFIVSDGQEKSQILVVELVIGELRIRLINGHGPQETDTSSQINNYWNELEKAVIDAKLDGCLILVEMDANAKVGPLIIPKDPNQRSGNGKLLVVWGR